MNKDKIFGAALVGVVALVGVSSLFSDDEGYDDDDRDFYVTVGDEKVASDGEIVIESRKGDIVVRTDDVTINCSENGGSVVLQRDSGKELQVICD